MIHCEIVSDINEIVKYRPIWDRMFKMGIYEPSVSYEWTLALISTHIEKEKDSFVLIIVKENGEIIGFLPLILNQTIWYSFKINNLSPICELYNTHSDILLLKQNREVVKEIIKTLFRLKYAWDIFRIKRILQTNILFNGIKEYLKEEKYSYGILESDPTLYVPLNCSVESYFKERSKNFRKSLKNSRKKIEQTYRLKYKEKKEFRTHTEAFNAMMQVETRSWKHLHGTSISKVKKQKEFYAKLIELYFNTGRLDIKVLYIENKPRAYDLGLIENSKYYYLKTSFDEDFRPYNPAMVLRAYLIENLINNNIIELDFTGEPYEWQSRWTNEIRRHQSILLYKNTIKGRLIKIYNTIKENKLKHKKINYHDPKALKPQFSFAEYEHNISNVVLKSNEI